MKIQNHHTARAPRGDAGRQHTQPKSIKTRPPSSSWADTEGRETDCLSLTHTAQLQTASVGHYRKLSVSVAAGILSVFSSPCWTHRGASTSHPQQALSPAAGTSGATDGQVARGVHSLEHFDSHYWNYIISSSTNVHVIFMRRFHVSKTSGRFCVTLRACIHFYVCRRKQIYIWLTCNDSTKPLIYRARGN